ncbi:alpha/beta fold hydrolase [Pseudochryseolinea flava]|uniref:Alpha/beta hydrolase n=1 Tax=Pseudochryseolinea flava TaxID=2059302 RepID=A0A364XVE3_9BACT|nr:alpha/beta hydrolase [Pseudochryseolinea flava]RAV98070.1 alpha/beta hydrolase [Pseudochryseolinea flava]
MKRSLKKKLLLIPSGVFVVIMVFMHSCMTFRMSPKEIDNFFNEKKVAAQQQHYSVNGFDIHYVQSGDSIKPLTLFVHGSPGSLSAFIDFLADSTLLANTFLITTDRPGFGYSNFGRGEGSLLKQCEALKPILEKHKHNNPVILVGHSLGGPLIAKMAIEYPDLIDGLIIVAGSIDPELEPNETWFRAPLATPFLSWIIPRSFRASNEEIYHLKPELEKMLPYWKNITCPVIVIHGKKDQLVDFKNVDFAKKYLTNAPVEYVIKDDMNHFVPWSDPELIRNAIIRMLNREKETASE